MILECINKYYVKGKVEGYELQDKSGRVMQLTKEQVKHGIKTKQFVVSNLQIDTMGRLVDKKIINNNSNKSDKEKWEFLFDYWYQHLPHHWVKFMTYKFGNRGVDSMYPPGFTDVFGKGKQFNSEGIKIAHEFEKYIKEKYNCMPVKVEVKSKNGAAHWVMYVMNIDGNQGAQECVTKDWYNIYGKEKSYYLNPDNYNVRGGSLDPAKQGLYKVQIIKSDIEGVKNAFDSVFIGRDGAKPNIAAEEKERKEEQFQQSINANKSGRTVNNVKRTVNNINNVNNVGSEKGFINRFMHSIVRRRARRAVTWGILDLFRRFGR